MSDVYLTRVDASQNMARYYSMSVQPNLFGEWSVVREWGRIGCGGQMRVVPYSSEGAAIEAIGAIGRVKERRGYSVVN